MAIAHRVLPDQKSRILLVENDPAVRRALQLLLQANGYDVRAYANGATLLSDNTAVDAACLIADYRLAERDGIETLARLRDHGWAGPAILITGFPMDTVASIARKAGFASVFEKPLRQHALVKAVARLLEAEAEC